jgi:hypothetical protein
LNFFFFLLSYHHRCCDNESQIDTLDNYLLLSMSMLGRRSFSAVQFYEETHDDVQVELNNLCQFEAT